MARRETDKNRKQIYFQAPLWELRAVTKHGDMSETVNNMVDRYRILMALTPVDLTDEEKMLLSAIFCGSELRGKNLRMHLTNMPLSLEDAGLDKDPAYAALLKKVEEATVIERLAMIESVGL